MADWTTGSAGRGRGGLAAPCRAQENSSACGDTNNWDMQLGYSPYHTVTQGLFQNSSEAWVRTPRGDWQPGAPICPPFTSNAQFTSYFQADFGVLLLQGFQHDLGVQLRRLKGLHFLLKDLHFPLKDLHFLLKDLHLQ